VEKDLIEVDKKTKEKKVSRFIEILNKKWLRKGLTTLILVLIIISIYVGVNILLEKVVLSEKDFTKDKIYSISDVTKTKIDKIEKEVNISVINFGDSLYNFAEKYTKINKNIKVENITNLENRTDLMKKYSDYLTDTTSMLIIVKSGEKEKLLTEYDLYTMDYSTYESIDRTEEAITNAIVEVTIDKKPKIYFATNHIAYDISYYSTLFASIQGEANEIEELDILTTGNIPEDCKCLILTTVKEDITGLERDKINEYIQKGGEILLLCGPNILNTNLHNFQSVLDQYGISISNGILFEGDSSKVLSGYNDCIITEVSSNSSLTSNLNMKMNIALIDAGKITFNEERLEELGVTYEELAFTSDKAFLRTNLNVNSVNKTKDDEDANHSIVGAIVTKTISEGKVAKLIVFSNELFVSDAQVPLSSDGYYVTNAISLYNNNDIVLNSIAFLTEREDTITIRKGTEQVTYTATEEQHNIVMIIIFGLPILIIILGIVVWLIRRRKK